MRASPKARTPVETCSLQAKGVGASASGSDHASCRVLLRPPCPSHTSLVLRSLYSKHPKCSLTER